MLQEIKADSVLDGVPRKEGQPPSADGVALMLKAGPLRTWLSLPNLPAAGIRPRPWLIMPGSWKGVHWQLFWAEY